MLGNIWLILTQGPQEARACKDFDKGLANSEKQSAAKTYMIGRRHSFALSRALDVTAAGSQACGFWQIGEFTMEQTGRIGRWIGEGE
jgi:hypothetical protein